MFSVSAKYRCKQAVCLLFALLFILLTLFTLFYKSPTFLKNVFTTRMCKQEVYLYPETH